MQRPRAFTMIETVGVILVLTILAGASFATYQWAITRANNQSAVQSLMAASAAGAAYYNDHNSWPSVASWSAVESAYTYANGSSSSGPSTSSILISVGAHGTAEDLAAFDSSSSTCFFLETAPPSSSTADIRIKVNNVTSASCYAAYMVSNSLTAANSLTW